MLDTPIWLILVGLPSGYLTVCHGKWPIYRWFTWVYLLKVVIFHGKLLNNQMVSL